MAATAGTTTIEVPIPLKGRLARLRQHPRQAYHEVIAAALDALESKAAGALDPLVAQHKVALRVAARRNRIERVWLVGSRARGEGRPGSDVDLLVKAKAGASLLDLAGFVADAEAILGAKVDLADVDGLRSPLRERILPEAAPV
jgi:predicted nucleotidyltransferase